MEKEKEKQQQLNKLFINIIIVLVLVFGTFTLRSFIFSSKFDSNLWKSKWNQFSLNITNPDLDASDTYLLLSDRKKMVSSLLKSDVLIGLNKKEVINILGLEKNEFDSNIWSYWVGHGGIGESKFLRIKFTISNLVDSVEVND